MRIENITSDHKRERIFSFERREGAGLWLLLVVKAKAVFTIGEKEIPSPEHSFVMLTPEQPFSYRSDDISFIEDSISFIPTSEEIQLINDLSIPLNKVVPAADLSQMSSLIQSMSLEYYSTNKNREESVDLYFRLLLRKLNESVSDLRRFNTVHEGLYVEKLLWLRESIYRWPSRSWTIDEMAADISLSRSRLQHLYSETFGVSISKDIINSRLDKAAELLKKPEYSINKVAELVGYPNASYFNRQFKNGLGMTPTEFRREWQEKEAI
ncbi:MAG: helix-turn-helix transcriptional regulator [Ruminococcus sp.]|uniref:AraC family transcriptional regulator n=1 Tax=Ruminococcus sp. TaxID=41978 RepID=UPI0025F383CC|nr:AraC family transcriptional regulator [Ruminococcus sp.]MBR5682369.1 helix-turn-helix transcriptional regulator [Ruminococcus sp.]